jgi:hypothetical protein
LKYQNLDFTLHKFYQLCSAVADNYVTITIDKYLALDEKIPKHFVLMRHDVDELAKTALKTARIEEQLGIQATYYFRTCKKVFIPEIIEEIEGMGHEVGYHYEVLSTARGDYEKAIKLFEDEVNKFREICNLKTICMHGAVLSKHDNRDLWKYYDFKNFGILGEAYLSVGENINYFTDTGRGWNSKHNLRDFIPGKAPEVFADKTDDLIRLIENKEIDNFYISTHPDRWTSNIANWSVFWFYDLLLNSGKKVLRTVRQ